MKRFFQRSSTLALALCFLLGALPILPGLSAGAVHVDDYELLYSNENTNTVYNDPPYYLQFEVSKTVLIQSATTYHWNSARGKAPGTISIYNEFGELLGSYAAQGRMGYRDVPNAYWDIFPNLELPPGAYYLLPSDMESWSYNEASDSCGFFNIRGYETAAGTGGNTPPPGREEPLPPSGAEGYINSPWATAELADALAKGLIPDRLLKADLRKPISRADFAAVSVKIYEYLSGSKAAAGSNPFHDTSDPEVIKAYHLGIVNGTGATSFSPAAILDREQMATMLTRAYKRYAIPGWTLPTDGNHSLTYTRPSLFADNYLISSWASESVYFMVANEVINGVGGNRFAPAEKASAEQALALAVRMANKLADAPSAGVEEGKPVPAKGTVIAGDVKLGFGASSAGTVTVRGGQSISYDGYSSDPDALSSCSRIALSEIPKEPITLSVKLNRNPSGAENTETFLFLGVEYKTESGNKGVLFKPVRATVSGGYATVSNLDLANYSEFVEMARPAGTGGGGDLKRLEAIGFQFLVQAKELQFFFDPNLGSFKVYASLTDKELTKSAAAQFLVDINGIIAEYRRLGFETSARSDWPFEIFITKMAVEEGAKKAGQDGVYISGWTLNGGTIQLNAKLFKHGYSSKTVNKQIYSTMVHEVFHFIQNCYVDPTFGALWFDEATASYYEYKFSGDIPSNYGLHHMRVFDGFIPSFATVFNFYSAENGYARLPVIQYLQEQASSDANYIRAAYAAGGTTFVHDWAPFNIEKVIGKNIYDMAGPFFEMYVTGNKLVSHASLSAGSIISNSDFDSIRSNLNYDFSSYGTASSSLTIPAFGARFVYLQPLNTPVDSEYVISTGSKDTYVVAMLMQGNTCVKTYTGKDGTVTVPVGLHDLLVMVVNKSQVPWLYSLKVSAVKKTGLKLPSAELLEKSSGEFSATIQSYIPGKTGVTQSTGKLNLTANKATGTVSLSIPSLGYTFSGSYDSASGMLRCPADAATQAPAATVLFVDTGSESDLDSSNPFAVIDQGGYMQILVYDSTGKIIAFVSSAFTPFRISNP